MSTAVSTQPVGSPLTQALAAREVRVYSHSMIFYWWPVWAVGYLLALVTQVWGQPVTFAYTVLDPITGQEMAQQATVRIHPSGSLGVIFAFTLLGVLVMTHFAVRGVASLTVIIGAIAVTLFIAYMGWWNYILETIAGLRLFMNLSFYLFMSTGVFLVWAWSTFVMVRFDYYVFRPGQLVHVQVFGGGEESYDTRGMSVVKMRDDIFRHWVLGLGSGDMHVATTGARAADFVVHNVLFVGHKLQQIQALVAMKPDDTTDKVFTAGEPV